MKYIYLLILTLVMMGCAPGHTDIDKVRLLKKGMQAYEVERILRTLTKIGITLICLMM
jgi:hypothetical protein